MISIIDYDAGNVGSIKNMLKRLGYASEITRDLETLKKSDKLILPGVGKFDYCMGNLERFGLIPLLNQKVLEQKIPILGICVGIQLFTKGSEEGSLTGLSWFDAYTVRFNLPNSAQKIPHMGWNDTYFSKKSRLFENMPEEPRFYYVHSYHVQPKNTEDILSTCTYGYNFVGGLERENIIGVQFHPEKSHEYGMTVLKNFAEKY
jgi:imidazole glycerol-phosphate synthase subunit HisH